MPIAVRDYTWGETEQEVSITLPLKGVKSSKADIFSTDRYIKVNYPPYIFEVHLYAPVLEENCTAKIGNGVVKFVLAKEEPGVWGQLTSVESEDKETMNAVRAEALEHSEKEATRLAEERAKKKREEERYAVKQEMKLEEEEREKIELVKQQERQRTDRELEEWRAKKHSSSKAEKKPTKTVTFSTTPGNSKPSDDATKSIWKDSKSSTPASKPPPPRKGGNIQVNFTPRPFPTAARESKAQEEEEWLTKMAAARKISTPQDKDSGETINERNPEFLKDKGVEFFKKGDYEAAINAFTEGIKLNPSLPQLFSNRAACCLALDKSEECIQDCSRALELYYPVVPSNYKERAKVFVRRGTAYANLGELSLAVQDYSAALKLSPQDEGLKEDYAQLTMALQASM